MKFKILKALVEKDALAIGDELFGYDVTISKVVDVLALASQTPGVTVQQLAEAIYDEIAKGILGDEYGER